MKKRIIQTLLFHVFYFILVYWHVSYFHIYIFDELDMLEILCLACFEPLLCFLLVCALTYLWEGRMNLKKIILAVLTVGISFFVCVSVFIFQGKAIEYRIEESKIYSQKEIVEAMDALVLHMDCLDEKAQVLCYRDDMVIDAYGQDNVTSWKVLCDLNTYRFEKMR